MNYGKFVQQIVPAVLREREYQDREHPEPKTDVATYIVAMMNEMDEVRMAWAHESHENVMCEILQVVSLGIAAMEQYGVHERGTSASPASSAGKISEQGEKPIVMESLMLHTRTYALFGFVRLYELVNEILSRGEEIEADDELVTVLQKVAPIVEAIQRHSEQAGCESLLGFANVKKVDDEEEF